MTWMALEDADAPWPSRTADLSEPERLVLGAFRHWLAGMGDGNSRAMALAWNELARTLGATRGRVAMSGLIGLIREMRHLRRSFRHHQACCPCVTGDEMVVLSFVAACQRDDWPRANGHAEWLVTPEGVAGLLEHGIRLAGALGAGGQVLPMRLQDAPPATAMAPLAAAATIH